MEFWDATILAGSLLLVLTIVASDFSSRLGAPLLLVFIFLGMLAGEDGPGGIRFDDVELSYGIGTIGLSELGRRAIGHDGHADRSQQAAEPGSQGGIIIDDEYHGRLL